MRKAIKKKSVSEEKKFIGGEKKRGKRSKCAFINLITSSALHFQSQDLSDNAHTDTDTQTHI